MKTNQIILILLFVAIMIVGILFVLYNEPSTSSNNTNILNVNKNINYNDEITRCDNDNDCVSGGCSGQLCLNKDNVSNVVTTCEWRDEYACIQSDNCLCIDNYCNWEEGVEYTECIQNL